MRFVSLQERCRTWRVKLNPRSGQSLKVRRRDPVTSYQILSIERPRGSRRSPEDGPLVPGPVSAMRSYRRTASRAQGDHPRSAREEDPAAVVGAGVPVVPVAEGLPPGSSGRERDPDEWTDGDDLRYRAEHDFLRMHDLRPARVAERRSRITGRFVNAPAWGADDNPRNPFVDRRPTSRLAALAIGRRRGNGYFVRQFRT
jgi:hypothetical protein